MAHAVSASSFRSDRMSPAALVLAILLHALVIAVIWWLSQDRFNFAPGEDVVEVTIEQPEPEPPPPPAAPQQALPPPPIEGLRPPADITAEKPTQVPQAEASKAPPAPAPPPLREERPALVPELLPPTPSELAKPSPEPPPKPEQQALVAPPPAPKPELRPSPLTTAPQRRPPAAPPAAEAPSQHPFVNPADTHNRARVSDNYLWQVVRKLSGYRYQAQTMASQGLTVVRVVIARNGRLLDVSIIQSSGVPEFDQGVLTGVRSGSPYSPLPPDIKGDSATFTLPLVSSRR